MDFRKKIAILQGNHNQQTDMKKFFALMAAAVLTLSASAASFAYAPEAQATTEAQTQEVQGTARQGQTSAEPMATQEVQGTATQTPKKVSILGDSYSTFQGHIPENYAPFYPNDRNDVTEVGQMWWSLYIEAKGYVLEKNDSWGGTTICGTGYGRMDSSKTAFTARVDLLGDPDIIFIFGGTNDAWAGSPVGEYQYEGWTKEDCKSFRPALAYLLDTLQKKYPEAQIYSILNSELREDINESCREVCKHYNVQLIELHDIEKQNGHPSISGMKSICEQLLEAIAD